MIEVDIDDKLSWNKHIDKVAKKVASGIEGIRKIRDFVDRQPCYLFTMLNKFSFCLLQRGTGYHGCGISNWLQKLQNRAARVINKVLLLLIKPELKIGLGLD